MMFIYGYMAGAISIALLSVLGEYLSTRNLDVEDSLPTNLREYRQRKEID
jgi:hypothetical protein